MRNTSTPPPSEPVDEWEEWETSDILVYVSYNNFEKADFCTGTLTVKFNSQHVYYKLSAKITDEEAMEAYRKKQEMSSDRVDGHIGVYVDMGEILEKVGKNALPIPLKTPWNSPGYALIGLDGRHAVFYMPLADGNHQFHAYYSPNTEVSYA
ncbi:hypothetical protein [Corynebacterium pseudopelargi]|uniref:Uncharacterized protein n=1 Tax=Corynebacterium pseudopelargi TaxID=2080757 RepID=A0A3G6IXI9_9CORY|nr:hypothetical protein [Corynebacterium pseudopelargi]AZA08684.1 hypothetical protein CPPEL_02765 [Corynebacterium pseudopelargi]